MHRDANLIVPDQIIRFLSIEDVSCLVRKYLPPGTIYDTYQFYCGWCAAHSVDHQASSPSLIVCSQSVEIFVLGPKCWILVWFSMAQKVWDFPQEVAWKVVFGPEVPGPISLQPVWCLPRTEEPATCLGLGSIDNALRYLFWGVRWLSSLKCPLIWSLLLLWSTQIPEQRDTNGRSSWCIKTVPSPPDGPIFRQMRVLESSWHIRTHTVKDLRLHDGWGRSGARFKQNVTYCLVMLLVVEAKGS